MFKIFQLMREAGEQRIHSPYTPASVYESPEFFKVSQRIILLSMVISIVIAYCLTFWMANNPEFYKDIANWVKPALSPLAGSKFHIRYRELQSYDGISNIAYASTILVGTLMLTFRSIALFISYYHFVLRKRVFYEMDRRAIFGIIIMTFMSIGVSYIIFISEIDVTNPRYRDSSSYIFIWHIFPMLGIATFLMLSVAVFIFLAGVSKLSLRVLGWRGRSLPDMRGPDRWRID